MAPHLIYSTGNNPTSRNQSHQTRMLSQFLFHGSLDPGVALETKSILTLSRNRKDPNSLGDKATACGMFPPTHWHTVVTIIAGTDISFKRIAKFTSHLLQLACASTAMLNASNAMLMLPCLCQSHKFIVLAQNVCNRME